MIKVNDLRAMTRDNLLDYLDGRDSKKLCHNTYVHKLDKSTAEEVIVVRYHGTDILTYWNNLATNTEFIQLNNGGWLTSTTKHRIARLSGLDIYQQNFNWFIASPNGRIGHSPRLFENSVVFHRLYPDIMSYDAWIHGYPPIKQGASNGKFEAIVTPKQQLLPFMD